MRLVHRDEGIAAVMEKEVLSRHRKALMLFGTMHLMHNTGGSAVSIYEKKYSLSCQTSPSGKSPVENSMWIARREVATASPMIIVDKRTCRLYV